MPTITAKVSDELLAHIAVSGGNRSIAAQFVEPGVSHENSTNQLTAEASERDGSAGGYLFCPGCKRTTLPAPALTRRYGRHERTSTTARSSFSYYLATA